ncbi:DUF4172 domain-containing protein [Pseudomonas sp. DCB_BI]|nr:DUF4172 domain-containing protein [Pseudomonas sp. DCB_BI]
MNSLLWIWQHPAWPQLTWQNEAIAPPDGTLKQDVPFLTPL